MLAAISRASRCPPGGMRGLQALRVTRCMPASAWTDGQLTGSEQAAPGRRTLNRLVCLHFPGSLGKLAFKQRYWPGCRRNSLRVTTLCSRQCRFLHSPRALRPLSCRSSGQLRSAFTKPDFPVFRS
jgi:hypothetical protein